MKLWHVICVLVTASALAFTANTSASPLHNELVQARVLSMHIELGHSSNAAQGGIDKVTLQIENVTKHKFASVTLLGFINNKVDVMPTVMKVSVPTTYVPKPNKAYYPYWLFRLRKGQVKTVVFTIRHVGDNGYCIGGSDYQTGTDRYRLCRP
jgi:hypothetical protein